MVNTAPGFNNTPAIIDGCSSLFIDIWGDAGRGARSAVGMAELPFDIAVEIEIDFALGHSEEDAAVGHIVICKLDAVYRRADRGDRIEIVDWKTGKAPRTAAEKDERMLQLALYRLAYHRRFGVPLEDIDVALYYVADDLVIRGDRVYSEEELVQRWSAARAAR